MTQEKLNEIANNYAKKVLGEQQFNINKDAVQSITTDFIDGFNECILAREESTEQRFLEATKMYNEYSTNPELYDNDFNKLFWKIVSL